jgi:hypothetical protein
MVVVVAPVMAAEGESSWVVVVACQGGPLLVGWYSIRRNMDLT